MSRTWLGRVVVVALACGAVVVAQAQQPPGVGTVPPPAPSSGPLPPPALDPGPAPQGIPTLLPLQTPPANAVVPAPFVLATPPVVAPASIEDTLAMIESLKRQREALERQEKQLAEQLRERLKALDARMAKAGLNKPVGEPKLSDEKEAVYEVPVLPRPRPVDGKK